MVIRSARKPKKTWAKAKAQSIRLVGRCRYCKKEITNDESFVCFADKLVVIMNVCVLMMKKNLLLLIGKATIFQIALLYLFFRISFRNTLTMNN